MFLTAFKPPPEPPVICLQEKLNSSDEATERQQVVAMCTAFLKSFEALDLKTFMSFFTEDASVFYPMPEPPFRVQGKEDIQKRFLRVFDGIRGNSGRSVAPFHILNPEDLIVQTLGKDAAVVSFHLKNSERTARRTLVLKRVEGQWRIVHLHASNSPLPSPPQ